MRTMNRYQRTSGARWALLQRHDIPDLLDPDTTYLTRWRLVQTPWFGIFVHAIHLADGDRHLHDHPWPFTSIILRGGYLEEHAPGTADALAFAALHELHPDILQPGVERRWMAGSIHRMRRGEYHRVRQLLGRTVTLVIAGRRSGSWGYATEDGVVDHETYHALRNPKVFGGAQ